MKHAHTAGWEAMPYVGFTPAGPAETWALCQGDRVIASKLTKEDAELLALAPTAPHDCDIPGCPGAENKRKLEAAGETEAKLAEARRLLIAWINHNPVEAEVAEFLQAKAQDAKVRK